jgi:SnoaL-like protein
VSDQDAANVGDYGQVAELFAKFGAAVDQHRADTLVDVLAETASFEVIIAGGDTYGPYSPRSAVIEFVGSTVGAQTDQRRHCITNFRRDGDSVFAYLSLLITEDGELSPRSTGVYEATLISEGGQPRINTLRLTLDRPF